jgi:hypothetical protein
MALKKGIKEVVLDLHNGQSFEIRAKKLIRIVKANEGLDEDFLQTLEELCSSTAKFIELFALVGAHTSAVLIE